MRRQNGRSRKKNMAKVSLRNIKKVYPNSEPKKKAKDQPEKKHNLQVTDEGVVAVQEFNLDIADKEFIVLVGPSGCGKSTTLRMIAGLEDITAGELYIGDKLVNDVAPKDRDIAMVFQNYALYPHMTVYENMAFSLKLKKTPKDEIDRKVKEAAEILDITQYLDRKPKALSGGQRQRVAIGRAIVRDPAVFLMDEPLSNLDAKLRVGLRSELKRLQKTLGITTLYVTHDQEEALTLSDKIAVFNNGFVEQVDVPFNIYNHSKSEFVCDFIGEINHLNTKMIKEMNQQCDIKLNEDKNSYVRLERVGFKPVQGAARFVGNIKDYDYNGVLTKYKVDVDDTEIRVVHVNDGQPFLAVGDSVEFYIQPADVMQF